jgi:hypothetical protein
VAAVTITELSANSLFGTLASGPDNGFARTHDAMPAEPGG